MKPTKFTARALPQCVALATMSIAASSSAAVLAQYDFASASPSDIAATTGVTASNLTASITDTNQGFSAAGTAFLRTPATGSDQAAALADDHFFSVTISASTVGETLNLTSLTLTLGGSSDGAANTTFTNEIFLQSTIGGFGTGNPVISGTGTTASIAGATQNSPFDMNAVGSTVFDLSGAQFQGLSTITFQFRLADSENISGRINRFDDVTINGTVIPEPSAALLGGLGLLVLLRRRR